MREKAKDLCITECDNYLEITLDTEDLIEGVAFQHLDVIETIIPSIYNTRGMKSIEFTGSMNVDCYIEGDCAFAEFECKASTFTVKKVRAEAFEMSVCPHCGQLYDSPLFTLDTYDPEKSYLCPSCNHKFNVEYEKRNFTTMHLPTRSGIRYFYQTLIIKVLMMNQMDLKRKITFSSFLTWRLKNISRMVKIQLYFLLMGQMKNLGI